MPPTIEELNSSKHAPVEGMTPILASRWSPRAFKDTPVSAHDLTLILEAARWTASSSNLQPWRYFVGVQGSETHRKIFDTLAAFNQSWAGKPAILLLGAAALKDGKGNPNRYALYDLGQSTASLVAQATALGLMSHSMGGFDHDAARSAFGLGEDYALGAVTAIGYQDAPETLANDQLRERELASRERKPLSEIALRALGEPFQP